MKKISLVKYARKYSLNLLGLLLGLSLILIALWQIDLICAPHLDWNRQTPKREILPGWLMYDADAYVMFYGWIIAGLTSIIVALWFWE